MNPVLTWSHAFHFSSFTQAEDCQCSVWRKSTIENLTSVPLGKAGETGATCKYRA